MPPINCSSLSVTSGSASVHTSVTSDVVFSISPFPKPAMPAVPHILEAEVRAAYEASTLQLLIVVLFMYPASTAANILFCVCSCCPPSSIYAPVILRLLITAPSVIPKKPAKYVSYSLRLPSYVSAVISVTVCMSILYKVCPLPSNVPLKFHGFQPSAPALDISISAIRI